MISDDEIKREIPETSGKSVDEIVSIHEVCLDDKFDRRNFGFQGEAVLPNSGRNDLEVSRYFRELGLEASMELLPDPGMPFRDLEDDDLKVIEDADTSSPPPPSRSFSRKPVSERSLVSSTSNQSLLATERAAPARKVDADDPRSRFHFVKYIKRQGRTVKLWECGICSREFQHQYTLMRHLPTHTDERNFHCGACGKSFRQLSTLSQHKAIHSTERPYSCEVCNKTFNRVSTLISHRKTHSNEKPYRCHLCPKGFHQKGNLRNHLFTHTNERPYRCNICLKGFNQQSNLVCHKNKAHPETGSPVLNQRRQVPRRSRPPETQPDSTRSQESEVTSSVGPYLPSKETSSSPWVEVPLSLESIAPQWGSGGPWGSWGSGGVVVDQINTYHMGVAMAMKQTPFALLKPDIGAPALVKVVDAKLPDGKQMLVPATAEDLRVGGQIVANNNGIQKHPSLPQLRVPLVATVRPTRPPARPTAHPSSHHVLTVEEPHACRTALSRGEMQLERSRRPAASEPQPSTSFQPPLPLPPLQSCPGYDRPGARISSSCSLPPPVPSPPLDLISLDLFEPIECIPMDLSVGPQVIPVDNLSNNIAPPSDDSDVFITEFEESIPLSD